MLKKNKILYYLLIFLGFWQIIGLIPGLSFIKGLGVATVAAPLPLVFSHFRGNETFAADFTLKLLKNNQIVYQKIITPAIYSKLNGPYNRRNIYGAIFAYGAYLDKPGERVLVNTILKNAVCNNGPLIKDFEITEDFDQLQMVVKTKTADKEKTSRFGVSCL